MQNQSRSQNNPSSSSTTSPSNKGGTSKMNSQMNSQTNSQGSQNAQGDKEETSESSSITKSVGAVIGESLAKDAQARVDDVMDRVNGYFKTAKEYVSENPKETAAIVAAVGVAAWVLLYTKPGRQVFEKGAAMYVPEISKWITQNLTSSSATKH